MEAMLPLSKRPWLRPDDAHTMWQKKRRLPTCGLAATREKHACTSITQGLAGLSEHEASYLLESSTRDSLKRRHWWRGCDKRSLA